jgi:hypothetical protein
MSGKRISLILALKALFSSMVRRETDIGMLTYKCRISGGQSGQPAGPHFPKIHVRSRNIWTQGIDGSRDLFDELVAIDLHHPWTRVVLQHREPK